MSPTLLPACPQAGQSRGLERSATLASQQFSIGSTASGGRLAGQGLEALLERRFVDLELSRIHVLRGEADKDLRVAAALADQPPDAELPKVRAQRRRAGG